MPLWLCAIAREVKIIFMKCFLFILLMSLPAKATEFFEVHTNARALGMGGAFITLVDTEEALFYNPAGIARNGGVFWTIADPKVGVSSLDPDDILGPFEDLEDQATFEAALNELYGEPIWLGASAKTSIMLPFFAAAYFYDLDASIIADNPVSPTLETNYINDTGIAVGTGFTVGGILQMGFALKYITRTGVREKYGTQTIADIIGGDDPSVIFDAFTETSGIGYSLDYGMNINLPGPVQPTISFVWKNIGDTSFRAAAGDPRPPSEPADMRVGASMLFDLPLVSIAPAIEIRQINQAGDEQIMKKVHMGVEIGLPIIDLRAGLHQGYYTAGVGVDLGLLQLDAATWGVELGGYPGQLESRRYMVQVSMRLGFDFGIGTNLSGDGTGAGASASGRTGSSSSRGGSGGSWFRGKKQRR